ncbi:D-aminoacyl-tRNA deacylase [Methylophaga thiooxydans]|uniref:D-aminoacyl-tRNA deacylase n=1 Tax=Methylophaga thiooxydans DMS010 TaxID=637616 RepID=C0N515_9GAMM|nr:D-aminoacyl-tRNA deacylase [Methylophaga thiooxydans]EEF80140.1 D-tyrosyl-tRNA(Tyr) deacylase [Methylophaga thiooxydans DMS010]
MIALLQRVTHAEVHVDDKRVAEIQQGLLVLLGVEKDDQPHDADTLLNKLLNYRVFADDADKMNLSLHDIHGGLLLVPQFTLPADTRKGSRPSFTPAAPPQQANDLFEYMVKQAKLSHPNTAAGHFGADMQVSLTNDGPVTFWLQTNKNRS